MRNLAIIPARSGSKGLPDKNIKELNGMPMIAYSIKAAINSNLFDEVIVSTDSSKYAEIAKNFGASVPFLRSNETSSDMASSWDVVIEVLSNYEKIGMKFDTICLLQPTSPLRTEKDIIAGYRELEQKKADAITSVCECDHSPLWCMVLDKELSLSEFRKNLINCSRQQLEQYYRINGAIYIRKIGYEQGKIAIFSKKEYALIMDRERSIDIDTEEDFKYANFLIKLR